MAAATAAPAAQARVQIQTLIPTRIQVRYPVIAAQVATTAIASRLHAWTSFRLIPGEDAAIMRSVAEQGVHLRAHHAVDTTSFVLRETIVYKADAVRKGRRAHLVPVVVRVLCTRTAGLGCGMGRELGFVWVLELECLLRVVLFNDIALMKGNWYDRTMLNMKKHLWLGKD